MLLSCSYFATLFQASGRIELIQDVSHCLGRTLYTFNCTRDLNRHVLADIFKGMAATGMLVY